MSTTKLSIPETLEPATIVWSVAFVLLFAASYYGYQQVNDFGEILVIALAIGIASVVITIQAYLHGNVLVSWLLATAPTMSFTVNHLFEVIELAPPTSFQYLFMLGVLSTGLFFGSTAHLLGVTIADLVGGPSERMSETERRVLLVVLLLTGTIFAYGTFVAEPSLP